MSQDLFERIQFEQFKPLKGFESGHKQTIGSRFWLQQPDMKVQEMVDLELDDGDVMKLAMNWPKSWRQGDRILVMIHGLTGCFQSKYVVRLNRLAVSSGYLSVRVNLRNCGPGFGLAKNIYHSGRSEDAAAVIRYLSQRFPDSPISLVGYSLGANISLKLAGEIGEKGLGNLDSVLGVSPPADLEKCSDLMVQKENRIYADYFIKDLRVLVEKLPKYFPEIEPIQLPEKLNIREFDELYTAPRGGFKDARDYYTRSSCGPYVSNIKIPGLVLIAENDPVIDSGFFKQFPENKFLDLVFTESGGHVGYLSQPSQGRGFRWMDQLLIKWIQDHEQKL